jgi:hypothetical protein
MNEQLHYNIACLLSIFWQTHPRNTDLMAFEQWINDNRNKLISMITAYQEQQEDKKQS